MRLRRTDNHRQSMLENLQKLLLQVLDYIICIYLVLLLAVFPFYNQEGYSHIGTDKAVFLCKSGVNVGKLLAVPLGLYLIVSIAIAVRQKRKWCVKMTATDIFALIYCGAVLLSYAFTDYREAALWGEKRWYMGLFPQLILICIYFLVSRFWTPRKWLFYIVLPVSGAVFLMGCANRFGFYIFGLEFVSGGYISTIGNINWYCGYAVSVVFAGTALLWLGEEAKGWRRALLTAYTALGYMSLVLQGSDSGLLALTAVMLAMFLLSAGDSGRMLVFWQEMLLLWGGCLAIFLVRRLAPDRINYVGEVMDIFTSGPLAIIMTAVSTFALLLVQTDRKKGRYRERLFRILTKAAVFGAAGVVLTVLLLVLVNTLHPGILGGLSESSLFTFNEDWGHYRGATWTAGWKCFAAQDALHKLVGVGPDCMWSYINSGASPELSAYVSEVFSGLRLTNAHNEWLTILVDEGILGLAGYGGMMVCGMKEFLKKGKENPFAAACGFCLLGYTVNNIVSFQQSMGAGTVFAMFGMGMAFLRKQMY